ncbi:TVP38/TMEM64 family protein [Halodesulfovibrio spirochaetisodalis]|uniref:TVP38/TMEM64 family membrane protein n=1 Tax=Halodesulfovibrio spirochaetisodalis TaxID=1560234 RepID=A0A1B7XFH5_9BACT|nr:TVP38/TMEM64 family protein [Halodesulfovibrio spirochaetisodalis]OBQ54031.1 dihydrolipoamide dehydrogenase [Halodesulfovibrio spirochaetisodalis]
MTAIQAKRLAIVTTIALLFFIVWYFNLTEYLTLEYIKMKQDAFRMLHQDHMFLVVGGFILIYILVTALSIPGAAIMTLAAGGLFGFWTALIAVSFASTIGATLACFVSRYILKDWVQKSFGSKIKKIDDGIKKEGAFYLFTVRLVPIFPFFAVNLVMGITSLPLHTFFWVSQLGMLPGTAVFVNAGKQLATINDVADVLQPVHLISFALLGIFPLIAKFLLKFIRKIKESN